jgi:antitoxin FitA
MAQLIVRNLDDGVKEKLKAQATLNGRSLEAEVRDVLATAMAELPPVVQKSKEKSFGELMHERFSKSGFTDEEHAQFEAAIAELRTIKVRVPDLGK